MSSLLSIFATSKTANIFSIGSPGSFSKALRLHAQLDRPSVPQQVSLSHHVPSHAVDLALPLPLLRLWPVEYCGGPGGWPNLKSAFRAMRKSSRQQFFVTYEQPFEGMSPTRLQSRILSP
jgi:hypothetical protein